MSYSAQHIEIDRIYRLISMEGYRSIAITACNAGEGVTTVATALTQRLLLSGHSTLLVELNFYHPCLVPLLEPLQAPLQEPLQEPMPGSPRGNQIHNQGHSHSQELFALPQLVCHAENDAMALTGIAAVKGKNILVKLRRPGVLESCITHWHQEFDFVVFDTSPLNRVNSNNLPAERAAGACDATLLVALARRTTEAQISEGVERLTAANATLAGTILNDRDNPCLKRELLRQLSRFGTSRGWLRKRLETFISQHPLLSLDV